MLKKNAAQKIHVYAYDSTTGAAKTGDAANITGYVSLDGTANAIDDTNPTEVDATNMPGVYVFDITAAETNCDSWALYAKSTTSNIRLEPIIGFTAPWSATRGLAGTALPDAAADSGGGLPISDAGGLDMDAKLANTNEVTAARMGALTDWIDGGRLDLILDAAATAAKLQKYIQLLARSDAAITTDNATELTEINANGGSGAGDYAATSDSQEAIRDKLPANLEDLNITDTTGLVRPDMANASGNYAGSVGSVTGAVGSVTGAVGSVTGAVGSVTGAVGSVTGAVGSVTGAVGSVTGSVGSVTAGVTLANGAHGGAAATITLQTPIAATVPDTQKVDVNTIKTQAVTATAGFSFDNLTTLIGKFTGITVLANWLRGLFRKDAMNATAKTEVNDTGGTYDEATDSNEAIRDTAPLGTAMRGTDGANTTTPPSVSQIRTEIETAGGTLALTKTAVDAVLADTGTDGVVVAAASKTGYALSATGLDSVATTAPTGVASTFREMLVQVWRRFFKKSTLTATELKTYADNGTDVLTTQAVTDDSTTQTQNGAT